ncbi:MAG TPA: rRNA maturation RNase YbeY [Tichowtungia sp.]|nr:rRNA maturation RNase YbeY [Tichowtungia sp.]
MKTTVVNHQTRVRINMPAVKALTAELSHRLVAADRATVWGDLSVVLTDDGGITQPNREFFGKNRPTDVISFRYDPVPGEAEQAAGDLIVNAECALREGPAHDGPDAELALYIAHGLNHLSGADDDTPQKRAAMRRTETRWLAELQTGIKNLIIH